MRTTTEQSDAEWMSKAIRLAMGGRGSVEPNPMVGCVLVRDGEFLAQGRHEFFGGPHAEANALTACANSAGGATAYVTLEPCCHVDKKTPPCVPALIAGNVSRVVIGCLDPNPQVAGRGVKELEVAGVSVTVGVLEDQAKQLNAAYFATAVEGRPYVTLKWAQSADGKVAGAMGRRTTISNEMSHLAVHALRARCDAIVVGIRTVLGDDPLLTARGVALTRPLTRVVLDPELNLKPECQLAQSTELGPVLVYCTPRTYSTRSAAVTALMARKIEVQAMPAEGEHFVLAELLADLHSRAATHVLVESGPNLARGFLAANLADRVWVFHSPRVVGEETAPAAAGVEYPIVGELDLDGDRLVEHLNPGSGVYFAQAVSADFMAVQDAFCVFPRAARV